MIETTFSKTSLPKDGTYIVGIYEEEDIKINNILKKLNEKTDGSIAKAINSNKFNGKTNKVVEIIAPHNISANRIILLGLGKKEDFDKLKAQNVSGKIIKSILENEDLTAHFALNDNIEDIEIACHIALGAKLASYSFDKYFTKKKKEEYPNLEKLTIQLTDFENAYEKYKSYYEPISNGVRYARDLVSEPGNMLNPKTYAKELTRLSYLGIDVEVIKHDELQEIGMNLLLSVSKGSDINGNVVILKWNGNKDSEEFPIALVGKGVTFDTGGISIKPHLDMGHMKTDMGGSAAVVATIKSLALQKANVNAIGVVGLVENMPSAKATKPGDVITSLSGQTVEIIDTDAEGRLVLADCITYVQNEYKPKTIIDLATLTGSAMVALGSEYAGLFSNNDELAEKLTISSINTGDKIWRMPLDKEFNKLINSEIADMRNIGVTKFPDASNAAHFIKRFVNEDVNWAHLDMCGVNWEEKGKDITPKGATGFGVKLLNDYINKNFAK